MQLKGKSKQKSQQEQVIKDQMRQGDNHIHVTPDATHTHNSRQFLSYSQNTDQTRTKCIHTKLVGKK